MRFYEGAYRDGANAKFERYLEEVSNKTGVEWDKHFQELAKYPLVADMAMHLRHCIKANVETIIETFSAMEERIAELEERGTLEYRDVWDPETQYSKGDLVTVKGSLWIAKCENAGVRPGEGDVTAIWKLCVRRGRDGKDASR